MKVHTNWTSELQQLASALKRNPASIQPETMREIRRTALLRNNQNQHLHKHPANTSVEVRALEHYLTAPIASSPDLVMRLSQVVCGSEALSIYDYLPICSEILSSIPPFPIDDHFAATVEPIVETDDPQWSGGNKDHLLVHLHGTGAPVIKLAFTGQAHVAESMLENLPQSELIDALSASLLLQGIHQTTEALKRLDLI